MTTTMIKKAIMAAIFSGVLAVPSFAESMGNMKKLDSQISTQQMTKLNINQADAKTIAKVLKGIGEKRAEAIVVYRTEHGDFTSLDDLLAVKGIGKSVAAKNAERIQFK